MINIQGNKIPNTPSEMTLGEYEEVTSILNNKHTEISEKYVKIFTKYGVELDYLNNLGFQEFANLIKEFSAIDKPNFEFVKAFEIDGYEYRAFEDVFDIKVADMKEVDRCFKMEKYICRLMAVIFKRTDLTSKEHYAPAHIKEKSKIFKQISAEICIPYLFAIGQLFSSQLQDAKSQIVE